MSAETLHEALHHYTIYIYTHYMRAETLHEALHRYTLLLHARMCFCCLTLHVATNALCVTCVSVVVLHVATNALYM